MARELSTSPTEDRLRRRRGGHRSGPRLALVTRPTAGRPTLLGDERKLEDFLTAIRAGNNRTDSALFAGFNPATVKEWYARGAGRDPKRPADQPYREFHALVVQAHAAATVAIVGNLVARSKYDHRAGLAWLEHSYPEEWGPARLNVGAEQPGVTEAGPGDRIVLVIAPELAAQLVAARRAEVTSGPRVDRLADLRVETDDEDSTAD